MKKLLQHKVLLILMILVLLATALSIAAALTGGATSPITNFFGTVLSPLRGGLNAIGDAMAGFYNNMYEYDTLKVENEALQLKIAQMEEAVRQSEQILSENERLRELHQLSERRRDFTFEIASVIAHNTSNWASSFTISKGTSSGLTAQMCVVAETGALVGYISEVGLTWATVTTLVDTDMECGAYLYRTKEQAVAEGDFDLMREGKLRISYLQPDSDIKTGDLVLTSGAGEIFPRDLVIGQVTELRQEVSGIAAYAVVAPVVDLNALEQVFVVKSFEITD